MTHVRERAVSPAYQPISHPDSRKPGAVRWWWGELTGPTRLLVAVNGVVIAGVGTLSALLRFVS